MRFFCLLALSGCLLLSGVADAEARGLTAWDVAQLKSVGSIAVSPDGEFVAYTVSVPRIPMEDDNGSAWTELHVYDRDSETSRPFITGEIRITQVKWSPDGNTLSYVAKRDDDKHSSLYLIPVGGGESRKLVEYRGFRHLYQPAGRGAVQWHRGAGQRRRLHCKRSGH